jgi:anti-sigma B factor antagonist
VTIAQRQLAKDLWLVEAQGRFDRSQTPEFEKTLLHLLDEQHYNIIVDFSQATYINSGGLRCLLTCCRLSRNLGGDIVLSGLEARIAEIFSMVGLDQVFAIYATPEEAVDHF